MGLLARLSYAVRAKMNAAVSRAEDPSETLDYSYERLRDQLQDVKRGIADLTTQQKRLEMRRRRLADNVEKHDEQAREAVRQDRDDLARRALEKKERKEDQIEDLDAQIDDVAETKQDLVAKKEDLERRIREFRTRKETMKARYEAAEASARVSEAVTGAGEEFDDVTRAVERATEQTAEMEARAAALDDLESAGVFESTLGEASPIDEELADERSSAGVEAELEAIKEDVETEAA
ncbi:MAG: PspA/IM30 family protein [Halobacteriaceae archaeon]